MDDIENILNASIVIMRSDLSIRQIGWDALMCKRSNRYWPTYPLEAVSTMRENRTIVTIDANIGKPIHRKRIMPND